MQLRAAATRMIGFGLILALGGASRAGEPMRIEVVDGATGRGVPLIELRTVHEVVHVTDSAGLVAFDEPGLMDREVFFHVRGHGYEFPRDGFGYRGQRIDVRPGGSARIEVKRVNIAERLYRSTGAGIYRDSVLLGRQPPTRRPVLNGEVLGQDSVLEAVFRGRIYWFWGDTNRPSYPLGTFGSPGAMSDLPEKGGLDPEVGVDLDYFLAQDGFVAPTADLPGEGPCWLDGLTVLVDPSAPGGERLFAAFSKVRPSMAPYRRGIAEFDAATHKFREVAAVPLDAPSHLFGHPFPLAMEGKDYVVCADPFPFVRVRAAVDAFLRPDGYEAFTCLLPSTRDDPKVDRDSTGQARYQWRAGGRPLDADQQGKLIKSGKLRPDEAMIAVQDAATGRPVQLARGSTYRNDFRHRWVMIATEQGGESSNLGEVWYLEADSPLGPWAYARKVVTHDKYTFYNPKQHPVFQGDGGRVIFFEGTYTHAFSGNDRPTPRYDYNQVTYKLDLADPRLNLPRPVAVVDGAPRPGPGPRDQSPAFYALDRPGTDTVPLGSVHILRGDVADPPKTTAPLYDLGADYPARYSFDPPTADARPVGRAWRVPTRFVAPG